MKQDGYIENKKSARRAACGIIMAVFKYDMAKIVHIKNKKVGLMNRLVQLIIIGYVIGSLTASLS